MTEQINKLLFSLKELQEKNFTVYFHTPDYKNITLFTVINIYSQAKMLRDMGYNVVILTDTKDVTEPTWIDEEFKGLPHISMEETGNIKLKTSDFIILQESQMVLQDYFLQNNIPIQVIVQANTYKFALEMINPGLNPVDKGITEFICNSPSLKEEYDKTFVKTATRILANTQVVTPYISDKNKNEKKIKDLDVAILCKDINDYTTILKTFYLRYPSLKFVNFIDMKGKSREEFAKILNETSIAVWVDRKASFGTFPLEAMKSGAYLVAKVPDMKQEFHGEGYGLWVLSTLDMVDYIQKLIIHVMQGEIPQQHFEKGFEYAKTFTYERTCSELKQAFENIVERRMRVIDEYLKKEANS